MNALLAILSARKPDWGGTKHGNTWWLVSAAGHPDRCKVPSACDTRLAQLCGGSRAFTMRLRLVQCSLWVDHTCYASCAARLGLVWCGVVWRGLVWWLHQQPLPKRGPALEVGVYPALRPTLHCAPTHFVGPFALGGMEQLSRQPSHWPEMCSLTHHLSDSRAAAWYGWGSLGAIDGEEELKVGIQYKDN